MLKYAQIIIIDFVLKAEIKFTFEAARKSDVFNIGIYKLLFQSQTSLLSRTIGSCLILIYCIYLQNVLGPHNLCTFGNKCLYFWANGGNEVWSTLRGPPTDRKRSVGYATRVTTEERRLGKRRKGQS